MSEVFGVSIAAAGIAAFGAVPMAVAILGGGGVLAALGGGGVLAAALRLGVGPADKLWNVALAFVGTALGVWRACAGHRAVIWNVASSARPAPKPRRQP